MDQAALLREMMSQLQQNEYGSVAILSTSEIENEDLFLKRMVDYYAKTTKKKTSLMGISGQGKEVKEMTMEKKSMDEIKEKQSDYVEWIPGSLHFISELRRNESLMVHFSQEMKKIEEQNEILFYYSGRGMEPTTINLSLASNKMIILMKPTKKSCIEVSKLMKIFSKIDGNNEVGIIVDTIDQEIFEEQIKKIQELCGSEFKYYMEPIGFFELNYAPLLEDEKIFEEFNFNYLNNKQNMKHFSDSILNMVM